MKVTRVLTLGIVGMLTGCFPFGERQRAVGGDYWLEQWEDGTTYYLRKKGDAESGGGALDGTIQKIGWNRRYIVAKRHAVFRGDPDGWMVVDTITGIVTGPLSDTTFATSSKLNQIPTFTPSEAWKKLGRSS